MGILKTIFIIVLTIPAIIILILIIYLILRKVKEIDDKKKVEILKAKYPLFKPVKVHMDLVYMDNNYGKLTTGLSILLGNQVNEGYLIREDNLKMVFKKNEDDDYYKQVIVYDDHLEETFIEAMQFFEIEK